MRATRRLKFLLFALLTISSPRIEGVVQSNDLTYSTEFSNSPLLFLSFDTFDGAIPFNGVLDTIIQLRGGGASASAADLKLPSVAVKNDETKAINKATIRYSDKNKDRFSLFQKGDGSSEDPEGIPLRYLKMQKNNRELALQALQNTLQWREEKGIDKILIEPHVKYDLCKEVFPHYFCGRDLEGNVVFVQRPAMLDLKQAKQNGLTNEDLLMHYIYVNEYLWQIIEADRPLGTMTSILDLQGLNLGVLKKTDILGFLKKFVTTMDAHFPQRSHKTLILNSPKWFNMLYKLISPLLRETTKEKIKILSKGKEQDKVLKEQLGDEACKSLPPSFWKDSKKKRNPDILKDDPAELSTLEQELKTYVSLYLCQSIDCNATFLTPSLQTLARIKDAGKSMKAIV